MTADWRGFCADHAALVRLDCGPVTVARHTCGPAPVYLATPYSREVVDAAGHWNLNLSLHAQFDAARHQVDLMRVGVTAVSPIVQAAVMGQGSVGAFDTAPKLDPLDGAMWQLWCRPMLDACCAVVVLDINGWQQSTGIWAEVQRAVEAQKPVFFYAGAFAA